MSRLHNGLLHRSIETLLSPAEMARADAASTVPVGILMQAAGRALARAARRFGPCRTLVLCGPGNNGGDGYVVARRLAQAGWPVAVAAFASPRRGTDAAAAAAAWRGASARFGARAAGRADLVIDAVFGAGLTRDVDGVTAETLRAARRVVAIDVPSGVDGETGAVRGYAPEAMLTVTFFRRKPGHLLLPGRDLCGQVVLADIGMPAKVLGRVRPAAFAICKSMAERAAGTWGGSRQHREGGSNGSPLPAPVSPVQCFHPHRIVLLEGAREQDCVVSIPPVA